MTKLEEKLLAQIRARLAELDVRASDKLAALLPALRKLTEGYAALGAAAKKTLAGLIPELAVSIEELMQAQLGPNEAFLATRVNAVWSLKDIKPFIRDVRNALGM